MGIQNMNSSLLFCVFLLLFYILSERHFASLRNSVSLAAAEDSHACAELFPVVCPGLEPAGSPALPQSVLCYSGCRFVS